MNENRERLMTIKQRVDIDQLKEVKIGYARVSSVDDRQELELAVQLEALTKAGCHFIFQEKQSGSDDDRPELNKAMNLVKQVSAKQKGSKEKGKSVSFVVYKIDRLTRKLGTFGFIVEKLGKRDVIFVSLQENMVVDSLVNRFICFALAFAAELELENIRSRTKEGLRKARERGVKLGNPGLDQKIEKEVAALYVEKQITVREIAEKCKVSEATVYNVARRNQLKRRKAEVSKTSLDRLK